MYQASVSVGRSVGQCWSVGLMTLRRREPQNDAENTLSESRSICCLLQNVMTINGVASCFLDVNDSWPRTNYKKEHASICLAPVRAVVVHLTLISKCSSVHLACWLFHRPSSLDHTLTAEQTLQGVRMAFNEFCTSATVAMLE